MKKIDRRTFVIKAAQAGSALAGMSLVPGLLTGEARAAESRPDISVVTGSDYFQSTIAAVEKLGGIGRFVSKGDSVGLMANTWAKKPGTYTKPEIVLAVAHLCFEAGAKKVHLVKNESESYWERSRASAKHGSLIAKLLPDDTDHKTIKIPGAKVLKEADILEGPLVYDRLFNLPIIKNHSGVAMTCTLKNMMGLAAFSTNIKFHYGPNYIRGFLKELGDFFADVDYFSQCVADLNRVRTVELCVVDATEFITTNGPSGPGEMARPKQVVAGTDRVAMDALCCQYLGLKAAEIGMITKSHAAGLGEIDLGRVKIARAEI